MKKMIYDERQLPAILTPEQVAALYQVSTQTVTSLCRTGKLRAARVQKQWRVLKADAMAYIGGQLNA